MRNWKAASIVVLPLCVLSRVYQSSSSCASSPALGRASLSNFSHSNRYAVLLFALGGILHLMHMGLHILRREPVCTAKRRGLDRGEQEGQLAKEKEIKGCGPWLNHRSILKRGCDMLAECCWTSAEDEHWKLVIGFGKMAVVDLDKSSFNVVMWWHPQEGEWGGDGLEQENRLFKFKDKVAESVGCFSSFLLYSYW